MYGIEKSSMWLYDPNAQPTAVPPPMMQPPPPGHGGLRRVHSEHISRWGNVYNNPPPAPPPMQRYDSQQMLVPSSSGPYIPPPEPWSNPPPPLGYATWAGEERRYPHRGGHPQGAMSRGHPQGYKDEGYQEGYQSGGRGREQNRGHRGRGYNRGGRGYHRGLPTPPHRILPPPPAYKPSPPQTTDTDDTDTEERDTDRQKPRKSRNSVYRVRSLEPSYNKKPVEKRYLDIPNRSDSMVIHRPNPVRRSTDYNNRRSGFVGSYDEDEEDEEVSRTPSPAIQGIPPPPPPDWGGGQDWQQGTSLEQVQEQPDELVQKEIQKQQEEREEAHQYEQQRQYLSPSHGHGNNVSPMPQYQQQQQEHLSPPQTPLQRQQNQPQQQQQLLPPSPSRGTSVSPAPQPVSTKGRLITDLDDEQETAIIDSDAEELEEITMPPASHYLTLPRNKGSKFSTAQMSDSEAPPKLDSERSPGYGKFPPTTAASDTEGGHRYGFTPAGANLKAAQRYGISQSTMALASTVSDTETRPRYNFTSVTSAASDTEARPRYVGPYYPGGQAVESYPFRPRSANTAIPSQSPGVGYPWQRPAGVRNSQNSQAPWQESPTPEPTPRWDPRINNWERPRPSEANWETQSLCGVPSWDTRSQQGDWDRGGHETDPDWDRQSQYDLDDWDQEAIEPVWQRQTQDPWNLGRKPPNENWQQQQQQEPPQVKEPPLPQKPTKPKKAKQKEKSLQKEKSKEKGFSFLFPWERKRHDSVSSAKEQDSSPDRKEPKRSISFWEKRSDAETSPDSRKKKPKVIKKVKARAQSDKLPSSASLSSSGRRGSLEDLPVYCGHRRTQSTEGNGQLKSQDPNSRSTFSLADPSNLGQKWCYLYSDSEGVK